MLTGEQREQYERDGFLVLPGFVDVESCSQLKARANQIVADFDPTHVSIFTTHEQTRTSDEYFLSSGDRICCFFEEEAFDDAGNLHQPKELSINKIGHAQHDLDPVFDAFSRAPDLAAVAHDVGLEQPLLLQSMYIFKQPHIGGEVVCHQDAPFLYTEPITVTGLWFAIEDATVDNGCLWALPGGHRLGLKQRFLRNGADDEGTRFEVFDDTPFPTEGLVPLEAEAGTLVVLHGLLPHLSGPNRSDRSRHAYSVHVIDGTADYPPDNWLRRGPDLPLKGF